MTDSDRLGDAAALDALVEAAALKDESRTGWELRGVRGPESVAAHAWGVSLLCLVFADRVPGVDPDRALRMAVVHDLGEARTGDVVPPSARADAAGDGDGDGDAPDPAAAAARERAALADLAAGLSGDPGGGALRAAWAAYEAGDSATARFVKDMDLLDMCLQALVYERQGRYDPAAAPDGLAGFFETAAEAVSTDLGARLLAALCERFEAARED